jgi:hydroxymethylpyrimidine/phosphomethylpyrimidine kinase
MATNHSNSVPPILLSIAGFDPSCGAGIAADLKTFSAHNCYGVAAVTSLTVQSTRGVFSAHHTPAPTLRAQLDMLADDIHIAAVKIGMLGTKANAVTVAEFLDAHKFAHVVLDTPFKSSSGHELYDSAGIKYLAVELMKRATVVTPNIPEAEILTGMEIKDLATMEAAARKLFEMGARAMVIKGGHMDKAVDVLFDGNEMVPLCADHVKTENTHGSGCTFASAIAAQLALGRALPEAVMLAKAYVTKAIEKSYPIGKGSGPLDHFYRGRQDPPLRGIHEVPQHGMHPAAEPATH